MQDTNQRSIIVSAPGPGSTGGVVLAASSAFCEYTGFGEEEAIGLSLQDLQPSNIAGSLSEALQAQQSGSGYTIHDVPLRLRSGAEERATIRASPLYCVESGALQGFSLLILATTRLNAAAEAAYGGVAMPAASVEGYLPPRARPSAFPAAPHALGGRAPPSPPARLSLARAAERRHAAARAFAGCATSRRRCCGCCRFAATT